MPFDGSTYRRELDAQRLTTSLERVKWLLLHHHRRWWTLLELSQLTGSSEAGVSARIRDLRKAKFGAFNTQARRRAGTEGQWEYRLVIGEGAQGEFFDPATGAAMAARGRG